MKTRQLPIIVIAALALFAVSCTWQAPVNRGSLAFTFSPRSLSGVIGQGGVIRVYLMTSEGTLYPIGPAAHESYDEVVFPAGSSQVSYTSPEIPSGQTYEVLVSMGTEDANGFYTPSGFGSPASVTVNAGESSALTIDTQAAAFQSTNLWGTGYAGTGIAVTPAGVYASTAGALYGTTGTAFSGFANLATLSGYTINSLSIGERYGGLGVFTREPWMNTSKGIVPFNTAAGTAETSFATGNGIQDVLQSASLNDGEEEQVVIYQRLAGLGGEVLKAGSSVVSWNDVDLSDFLTGKPILDFVSTEDFAFFATSLGAFRVPKSAISGGMDAELVLNASKFFNVNSATPPIPILSLSLVGSTIYIGTADGVWTATINTTYPQTASDTALTATAPVQISGTAGKTINKIQAYTYGGSHTLITCLGDSDLFIINGSAVDSFPFYSGLPADVPGELKDVAWYDTGSSVYVLVAGAKGLVTRKVVDY